MKKNSLLKFLPFLVLIFSIFFGFSFAKVNAQDSELEVQSSLEQEQIFNKDRNTQKIADLRILYRDQIEVYRNSEKDFNIAKTNYINLETLKSLEEAVSATEFVMKNRAKVLITYLELLKSTLEETAGIELALKTESLKNIDSLITDLRLHQDSIALAKDRIDVNALADSFEVYVAPYNQVVYKALSLVRIGQLQAVYDVTTLIDADIKKSQDTEDVGAVKAAKRDRAYQEIQRNLSVTNDELAKLNLKIIESKEEDLNRYFYEKVLEDLGPVYTKIYKSLDYLDELLNL